MAFTDVLTALPFIKSGKLRALGVTTRTRSQALPDLPTVAEQGVPGFDVSVFFGVVAPAGTPADVIAKLNHAFADALQQPSVRKTLQAQGLEFAGSTAPQQLEGFIKSEVVRVARRGEEVGRAARLNGSRQAGRARAARCASGAAAVSWRLR